MVSRASASGRRDLLTFSTGRTLDVGAGRQSARDEFGGDRQYIALDFYETSTRLYKSPPDVYGDGQALPFTDGSLDTVLLLDVLEHIPDPNRCVREIARVLKPGGRILVKVPFLYPLHDVPFDFQRWTRYGLTTLARRHGLRVAHLEERGASCESAALLMNLAMANLVLGWIERRNPLLVLVLVLPLFVFIVNLLGWALSFADRSRDFMPIAYTAVLEKPPVRDSRAGVSREHEPTTL